MQKTNNISTVVQQTSETLKLAIENGTFPPGSKLPPQRQMEEMLNVSRSAIREAVKTLEGMGLLYSRRGSGTYVVDQLPTEMNEQDNEEGTYKLSDIRSLSTEILDYSTGLLASQNDKSEIIILKEHNDKMRKTFASLSRHEKFLYESSFGNSLVRLAGNELNYHLFIKLMKPVTYIDNLLITSEKDYMNILMIDSRIIESILEGNADRARFWGLEREREVERIIELTPEQLEKVYKIF